MASASVETAPPSTGLPDQDTRTSGPSGPICEPQHTMVRQTTQEVQALFDAQVRLTPADLKAINGEAGDVVADEAFAVGQVHLTFEDVSFSIPKTQNHCTPHATKSAMGGRRSWTEFQAIMNPEPWLDPGFCGFRIEGQLVALMGPSGSGKTTLLDILAGKKSAPHEGTIHVNGRPRDMLWNRISAYDDLMFAHLTVEEVLRFHANLKTQRPARITRQMDQLRIEAPGPRIRECSTCANQINLARPNSYIGDPKQGSRGISGGQRRRLSLVKGVACGARVMFCDEPTSGLSATDAELCVRYMRWLAHRYSDPCHHFATRAVLIIMSIHQPRREVARLFDELILLTSRPGPMRDLADYSAKVGCPIPLKRNPTDFIMDLITPGMKGARENEFVRHFQAARRPVIEEEVAKHLNEDAPMDRGSAMEILRAMREPMQVFGTMPPLRNSKFGVPFRSQVRAVAWRQFKLRYRNKTHLLMDLAAAVAKAVILGLAFFEPRLNLGQIESCAEIPSDIGQKSQQFQVGFFFFVLMACSIDQVKTMPAMIAERNVMKLETSEALYSEWAYILPVTLMSAMQAVVTHFVFIALLWPFLSFPVSLFGHVWFWSLMVNMVMDSLYVMLSGIAKDDEMKFHANAQQSLLSMAIGVKVAVSTCEDATIAQIMSLPFLLIFMLYNGFTVYRTTCPKWLLWALNISPVAYAMEAITIAAARICVYDGPACGKDWQLLLIDGFAILGQFSYIEQSPRAIVVMCADILVFRAVHMVCLKFLNNIRR
eukprot:s2238_g5.t1